MSKRKFHIILFSFGVAMVLLRPFMAYQLSNAGDFGKNPQRVYNLLQRLVKKKDDHHAADGELTAVLTQGEAQLVPTHRVQASFLKNIFRRYQNFILKFSPIQLVSYNLLRRYNILICKFQI